MDLTKFFESNVIQIQAIAMLLTWVFSALVIHYPFENLIQALVAPMLAIPYWTFEGLPK